jgi:PAS domain S-box-containing protein
MRKVIPLDVVETIREGLLVLEPDLTVRFVNRSFCQTFAVTPKDTVGRKLYELGNGQWDIPKLRTALETIISGRKSIEAFEVDQFFPSIGRRVKVLNARKIYRPGNKIQQILVAIEDVTERVRLEREHAIAHQRISMLMPELTHRVKNSLQSSAAMVSIEARSHKSGEGKAALERVSHRIDALGQLYSKLSKSDTVEAVDAATYLDELCRDLPRQYKGATPSCSRPTRAKELNAIAHEYCASDQAAQRAAGYVLGWHDAEATHRWAAAPKEWRRLKERSRFWAK